MTITRTVLMALIGLLVLNSGALAAPPEIENFCFAQIEKIRPPLSSGRGDREAFMANCIANLTPTVPAQRSRYKKSR